MLKRPILLALAVCCSSVATVRADDFLLRLDAMGYVDRPTAENPKEALLHSIEVIARPEVPFHTKIVRGPETLRLAGKLSPADDGGFVVQVSYANIVDTGTTVPKTGGGEEPILDETSFETGFTMTLGEPVTAGGMETKGTNNGQPERASKLRCVLNLSKYEPAEK